MKRFLLTKKFYAGEGEGGNSPPPAVPPPPPPPTAFTQEQVNSMLAKEKKVWQEQQKKTVAELEQLRTTEGLSKQQVEELQQSITALEKQYLTKEELSKREADKQAAAAKAQLDLYSGQAKTWQTNFQNMLVENEIVKASVANAAFSDEQILALLSGKAKVTEILAEGKPTGKYQVLIAMQDAGKDLELTPADALKLMKDQPQKYGNLFKSGVAPGVGGNNNGGTGTKIDYNTVGDNPEFYRANRQRVINGQG